MHDVMNVLLGALRQDTMRVERIGVNLANALTPGHARELLVVRSAPTAAAGRFADLVSAASRHVGAEGTVQVVRDLRPGTLKPTGDPWHLALASPGYFEVATPDGPAYTRRGDFRIDPEGRLVTAAGWPVMGLDGELRPGADAPTVDAAGQVRAGPRLVGQLKVTVFDDPSRLRHLDGGYVMGDAASRLVDASQVAVRQGFVENSNVSSGAEMVDLMRTMRHFESMTRAVQGYDEMLGGAIRRLGQA